MPMNLEQLEAYLVEDGLRYQLADDGYLLTGFATRHYTGPGGRAGRPQIPGLDQHHVLAPQDRGVCQEKL